MACETSLADATVYHSETPAGVRLLLIEVEFPLPNVPRLTALPQLLFEGGGGGGGGRLQVRVATPLFTKLSATVPVVAPIVQGRPFRLFNDARPETRSCQSAAHVGRDGSQLVLGLSVFALVAKSASQ